ncbi:MAG: glycoside hydrolase family 2 TIM barrel-domain containing protein [Bacteroidota bacterium]|nr:glycoside hydrolase family 2 TIM barrel-domain containing protein [Bacteroidota bacterium]
MKIRIAFLFLFLCGIINTAFAQFNFKPNYGLAQKQAPTELPKSKAPVPQTVRLKKQDLKGTLRYDKDDQYIIASGWELTDGNKTVAQPIMDNTYNTAEWYNATVPGTVLTTLVNQGVYPNPYYGLNNLYIPDTLCRMDWWYRVKFDVPTTETKKLSHLLFNGINYRADIWLNGKLLGNIAGAFKRGYFDTRNLLKSTNNVLAVHIYPPNNAGIPHEENKAGWGPNGGLLCLDGPTFISSEGWDWVPGIRDRNIGIWQDVRLCLNSDVELKDPQVITDLPLPDTTSAKIIIKAPLYNSGDEKQTFDLACNTEGIDVHKQITLNPKENRLVIFSSDEFPALNLRNPRLWWPNGYGKQSLYTLKITASNQGETLFTKNVQFGIRELSYQFTVDVANKQDWRIEYSPTDVKQKETPLFDFLNCRPYGNTYKNTVIAKVREGVDLTNFTEVEQGNPFLVIKVNGKPIYCKGGNWGMDDAMKNTSNEFLEPYFRLHKEENFNMIRNWTGESTEESFYNLCDKYGMLVWNDFSMSTGGHNLNPADNDLFMQNTTEIVKRFRNHPSIALWCARNEGYAPAELEERIQQLIAKEDGSRHYIGNSVVINMLISGPHQFFPDPIKYYNNIADGFNTEFGTISMPAYQTLKKFIAKEDIWPISDVWYYHDLHLNGYDWKEYIRRINALGKDSCQNAEEFCKRAQVLNFNNHRAMFEAWNHKLWNNASGVLLWMSHPAWPSMMWQTYSYDYETFGSFYGSKKGCEPQHIQWNLNNHKVVVINASLKEIKNAKAKLTIFNTSGKQLMTHEEKVDVPANAKTDLWVTDIPQNNSGLVLFRLTLTGSNDKLISENDYWLKDQYDVSPPDLGKINSTRLALSNVKKENNMISCKIKNTGKNIATFIKLNVVNSATGEIILPAYASDGYFSLLPNQNKKIEINIPALNKITGVKIVADGLNCSLK